MAYKLRKTKKVMTNARKLLRTIPRERGEVRSVRMCNDCGKLFGRRFIPYSLGVGVYANMCMCQLTGHRPSQTVIQTKRGC